MPLLFTVDAFTKRPFSGNPAAVCLLKDVPPDDWLQSLAAELNLAETAFTWKREDGLWPLRWFTPKVEVDLCGHATLATAHILWETGIAKPEEVLRFETRSGILTAAKLADEIELDFPATPCQPCEVPADLASALGVDPVAICRSSFDYLVEVASPDEVCLATPRMTALKAIPGRGVILTARGSFNFDFVSRFFAPAVGVDEDPVTGSAHCALACYWGEKLRKTEMLGYQASARGGTVRVNWVGDRVRLRGQAVTMIRGEIRG